ncbi:MAG: GDSL-type esterase/lipase family protein [Acutalibacteraceae bacterium]
MKKILLSVLIFGIFAACISYNAVLLFNNKYLPDADTEKGKNYIEKIEKTSVEKAEKSIDAVQKKLLAEKEAADLNLNVQNSIKLIDEGKKSYIQVFRDVYIAGDSLMHGLKEYNILNSSHLITQVSASLSHLNANFDKIVGLRPPVLILHYGLNMCSARTGADTNFINEYTSIIERLKKELSDTRIIISLIFPVDNSITRTVSNDTINKYNDGLVEMCKKEKIEYLDSSSVLKAHNECFEPDGIHQKKMFYDRYWLKFVMTEKGIY